MPIEKRTLTLSPPFLRIIIRAGDTRVARITFIDETGEPDENGEYPPMPLLEYTFKSQVKTHRYDTEPAAELEIDTSLASEGVIDLIIQGSVTKGLTSNGIEYYGYWDLQINDDYTVFGGPFQVELEVTE